MSLIWTTITLMIVYFGYLFITNLLHFWIAMYKYTSLESVQAKFLSVSSSSQVVSL